MDRIRIEYPGGSNSREGWESPPPNGQGFPSNASSAGGKSVLRPILTEEAEREAGQDSGTTEVHAATQAQRLTLLDRLSKAVALFNRISLGSAVMARTRRKRE